jgi:glycosyltransferase involved in cell wall biosynthesis
MSLRVLCLDNEGGHGGSSRSLYETLRHIDREAVLPEVWCRRPGHIEDMYGEIGIECQVEATLPRVTSVHRFSRNLVVYAHYINNFLNSKAARERLTAAVNGRFDLVHFNHENFFLLALWLRTRTSVPFTMHVRTSPWESIFARWQARSMARAVDKFVFITEGERGTLEGRIGPVDGTVVYNIVDVTGSKVEPHESIVQDDRLRIACLNNYSWRRGTDRLVDIAVALAQRGRRDFHFIVAGDMNLRASMPGQLGRIGRRGGTMVDYADHRGVGDMFTFLGFVRQPSQVLAACDVLAKLSRDNNPWGRDVLEGLATGLPVIATGGWSPFIEDGVSGKLQANFDPKELADELIRFKANPAMIKDMGRKGRETVLQACAGEARAADVLNLWQDTVTLGRQGR